jgi:hypothetical protein
VNPHTRGAVFRYCTMEMRSLLNEVSQALAIFQARTIKV